MTSPSIPSPIYEQTSNNATLGSWSLTMAADSTQVLICTCSYFAFFTKLFDTNMWSSCCAFMSNRYV